MADRLPEPGSARHLVWLYGAEEDRARIAALFALEQEIMASASASLDHSVAHARLAWWQEECERLAAALPRHPQAIVLLQASRQAGAAAPDLTPLVAAARWDLANATPANRSELEQRCREWSRGVFRHLLPAREETHWVKDWLAGTGALVEELHLLCSARADARLGRLRAPLDELEPLGAAPHDLALEPFAPALADYVAGRHRTLGLQLARQLTELEPAERPALRAALVWVALALGGSARALAALPRGAVRGRFDPLRDNWAAWRAARRALTQRLPPLGAFTPSGENRRAAS